MPTKFQKIPVICNTLQAWY